MGPGFCMDRLLSPGEGDRSDHVAEVIEATRGQLSVRKSGAEVIEATRGQLSVRKSGAVVSLKQLPSGICANNS